jgi:hypothetical protein
MHVKRGINHLVDNFIVPWGTKAPGIAQGDFDECWVPVCRARQHGDAQAGAHQSAQGFMLLALEGELRDESCLLT